MPTTRATFSQNRPTDDDVPPPFEDVSLMSVKRLYSYLGTLVGLFERHARGYSNNGHVQSSFSRGNSFDVTTKLGLPCFSGSSDLMEAEAWNMKIEKFFDIVNCFKEKKASYASFMLDNEADH